MVCIFKCHVWDKVSWSGSINKKTRQKSRFKIKNGHNRSPTTLITDNKETKMYLVVGFINQIVSVMCWICARIWLLLNVNKISKISDKMFTNHQVKWRAHILMVATIYLGMTTQSYIFNYGIIFVLVDTFQSNSH